VDPTGDHPLYVIEGLTHLFNVVFFESLLETELSRATRYGHPLSVLVAEIDGLAELEAAYGYEPSGRLVRAVGERISTAIRDPDTLAATNRVAALGTQRFLVLLPETGEEGAFRTAEKIRTLVGSTPIEGPDGNLTLTISIGVASTGGAGRSGDDVNLIGRATQALFIARSAGRSRIQVSAAL
jgi:diguanylate cyclase (GGDEF)-like protein